MKQLLVITKINLELTTTSKSYTKRKTIHKDVVFYKYP